MQDLLNTFLLPVTYFDDLQYSYDDILPSFKVKFASKHFTVIAQLGFGTLKIKMNI